MVRSTMLFCAVTVLVLAALASAELVIRKAGVNGKYGTVLKDGVKLCLADYESMGFSIECRNVAGPVQFYVNGAWVRTENVAPYMIAGDSSGNVFKWTAPTTDFTVDCRYSGKISSASVKLYCPPTPVTVTPVAAVVVTPVAAVVVTPVAAVVATPVAVLIPPPGAVPAPATQTPTPLPTQAPSPPPMTMSKGNDCIKIKGNMNMENALPNGWTVDGTSVWYKRGSTKHTKTVPGGTADLEYMFISPKTGTFGITLSLTTGGKTDFNDVWLKFRYGLKLMKKGEPTKEADGKTYVKAYHNRGGTAVEAWSVDHNYHAISTGTPLRAGMMYKIVLGARSENVKVNSIVMFPCEGEQCTPESPAWAAGVAMCQ